MKQVRVLVSGQVQGVFYRDACRRVARENGVTGWVRNLSDGRVEAMFAGSPEAVETLVAWAGDGPVQARVTAVQIETVNAGEEFVDFQVR